MEALAHGHLGSAGSAPMPGERVETLALMGAVRVERIVGGALHTVDFDQDHDEWVVLLEGAADIEVDGEQAHPGPGDGLFLARRTPHRLVRSDRASSWLAVHVGG